MVGNLRARCAVWGVCLLMLMFFLAACVREGGPGPGTDQTLTVTKEGAGIGTVTGPQIACGDDCTGSYTRDTEVTLTVMPDSGSTFAGWGGDCTGMSMTCELVMDGAKAVTATFEAASPAPASALGDSPTIAGTFANFSRGDFGGKKLELKAGEFTAGPEDAYATSPVGGDGSFSLQLPGESEMAPRLFDAGPEFFFGGPECDTTVTPETFKLRGVRFFLHVDGEITDEVLQTNASIPNSFLVNYLYVDRDVRAVGTCSSGDYAGLEIDVDLRKGWNTMVFDFDPLEVRNEDLSEGYAWVIPSLCTIEGECPSD